MARTDNPITTCPAVIIDWRKTFAILVGAPEPVNILLEANQKRRTWTIAKTTIAIANIIKVIVIISIYSYKPLLVFFLSFVASFFINSDKDINPHSQENYITNQTPPHESISTNNRIYC